MVLLRLAERLASRGHGISLLGSPALEEDASRIGIERFRPMTRIDADIRDADLDPVKDWRARTQLGGMLRVTKWMFVDALPVADDTTAAINELRPDVGVVDAMLLGAIAGVEASRLPGATLLHGPWFVPTPGAAPFGLGRLPKDRRLHPPLALGARTMFDLFRNGLNRVRRELGLAPVRHLIDQFLTLDRTLVLTSSAFDMPPDPMPEGVYYVGPELDRRPGSQYPLPPGESPLVLASFSTTYQGHEDVIQRVINAIAACGARGVVTAGPVDCSRFTVPPGISVVPAAPHAAVVSSANAVVTHGGHGTVMEALAAGVPLLCIPISRDQPDVAARVVRQGAGLSISRRSTTAAITTALNSVLIEQRFRTAASDLQEEIRREYQADQALAHLEALGAQARSSRTP